MHLRIAVLAVLLTLLSSGAAAQPELRSGESQYYTVHTNVGGNALRPLVEHMDRVFGEFRRRFAPLFRDRQVGRMDLYLVRTREDYVALLGSHGIDATGTGGMFFYRPGAGGLATWVEGRDADDLYQTLQHEAFHQFAHNYIGPELPVWANEGLAEYFGDAVVVDGRLKVGLVNERRLARVRRAMEGADALGFDDLIDIDHATWRANMHAGPLAGNQYAQAWSVAYFLAHADGGRYQRAFEAYLDRLARGEPHRFAFSKVFGDDRRAFEKAWRQFIADLEPDPYTTALQRLEFLAHGMRWLDAHEVATPADLDALRTALERHQFELRRTSVHGGEQTAQSADDASLYTYTARDRDLPFALKPTRDDDLPPTIYAPALRPRPGVVWDRDESGKLTFRIAYD